MRLDVETLKREDCFLVLVDAQEKLMPVISETEAIAENMLRLASFARITGLPVLVTEQQKLGPTLEPIREALGTPEAVSKITFNCFDCPEFAEKASALDRKTMLLAGVESHICVAQTALSGLRRGYKVHVVSDAAGSRRLSNWAVAMERMKLAGAVMTSTEMLIYEILERAGTDEFRQVLPLVK